MTESNENQWIRDVCKCGHTFRFQRKDFCYDRRDVGWMNCPRQGCDLVVSSGWKYE